ncbi:sensor histidine kinase [Nocardia vaccinii]|uniref:sensor histidine kinase n=1 Tax=Nocardia vaccinii TaxID=1822 RepID=UPI00083252DE|nr:sensor histidine kinase [Nocardia vaccinii]
MDARMRPSGRVLLPALIAAVVQAGAGARANAHWHETGARQLDVLGYALLLAGPALLLARRAYPRAVLYAVLVVTLAYLLLGYGYGPIFIALAIAFLSAARRGSRWYTYSIVPLGYLLMVWPAPFIRGHPINYWQIIGLFAWLSVLVALAEGMRQRRAVLIARRQRAEAAQRNERAERAREQAQREQRASEERLAIARELHDVLAHSLSLINVQSSVALELLDRKPEQAATALAAIKSASRDALGEVHALLRSIRAGTETVAAPKSPAVRVGDLDALIEPARAAGLTVRAEVSGDPVRLPAVLDVAAARIVRESLTNVLRHAPGASAVVGVVYSPDELRLTVENTGPANTPQPSTTPGGNGIPGMRERAHALNGELAATPLPSGGFRVTARLPIPQEPR